jgi:predicted nucleic acid-binding protein
VPDFVIDASTTLAWLLGEEEQRRRLPKDFDQAFLVAPWLWRIEICNVILKNERRGKISVVQGTRLLQIIDAMQIEVVSEPANRSIETLALFSRPHQLTSYDALYLELAISLDLPLCTLDRNLQSAARRSGLTLIIDYERSEGSAS